MMKNIIIFYESLSREYVAAKKIKESLINKHSANAKIFSISFDYNKALNFAKKNKIDSIIVPWMYRDSDYSLIMPFLILNEELKVFNLYSEQIASDETLSITIPQSKFVKNNVFHLCWGSYFKDLLNKNGVDNNHSIISGNSRLDSSFNFKKNKEELSKEFNLDINKKWVLFAESRDWVIGTGNLKNRISIGLPVDLENESYAWHTKSLQQTYQEINELPLSFFDKYELIYRPHPTTASPQFTNNKIKIITNYNIYEWLGSVDYYLTATSSSIFEADAMGIPSMVVNFKEWPKKFETYGLEEYHRIYSLLDFNEENINKAILKTKNKKIYEKYIGKCDGKRCENIADIVISKLEQSTEKMEKLIPYSKQTLIQKLHYIYSITMLKLNLPGLLLKNKCYYLCRHDYPYSIKNKKMYGIK